MEKVRDDEKIEISEVMMIALIGAAVGFLGSIISYTSLLWVFVGGFSLAMVTTMRKIVVFGWGIFFGGFPLWLIAAISLASTPEGMDWALFRQLIPLCFAVPATFIFGASLGIVLLWIKGCLVSKGQP